MAICLHQILRNSLLVSQNVVQTARLRRTFRNLLKSLATYLHQALRNSLLDLQNIVQTATIEHLEISCLLSRNVLPTIHAKILRTPLLSSIIQPVKVEF